jgi:hypothetical protein
MNNVNSENFMGIEVHFLSIIISHYGTIIIIIIRIIIRGRIIICYWAPS